jgi:hypothetical protein
VKLPVLFVAQLTVPPGALALPVSMSATVAVQVAAAPTLSGIGVHVMLVLVTRGTAVKVVEPLLAR